MGISIVFFANSISGNFCVKLSNFSFKYIPEVSLSWHLLKLRYDTFVNNFMIETIKSTLARVDKSLPSNINFYIFEKAWAWFLNIWNISL